MNEMQRIRRQLESQADHVMDFLTKLRPEQWNQQVYTTGSQWRVRQVLAHFVSTEKAFLKLIRNVLNGGPGAPQDFDIDAFNEEETPPLSEEPIPHLLRAFESARKDSIALLDTVEPSDLDRTGYHPWFGDMHVGGMLKLVYRHNMIHLRDVRKALKTSAPVPHLEIEAPSREKGKQ